MMVGVIYECLGAHLKHALIGWLVVKFDASSKVWVGILNSIFQGRLQNFTAFQSPFHPNPYSPLSMLTLVRLY